ncbi:expressed unknown protein [Seminavis robusta]|uniref:Uncharacterized protein n=1 Tax=Seminavis robusta TaxID=568900 RepID=A0A9N8HWY7_9STRA|nr:expressed unknown protein [Seminavis robusta]|eukprot:Sro2080_g313710.1 n/a (361) ;mRNA; r:3563-4744
MSQQSSPAMRDRSERSHRDRRTTSPIVSKPSIALERSATDGRRDRDQRDRERTQRERQRSVSPSARRAPQQSDSGSVSGRNERVSHRSANKQPRRRTRKSVPGTGNEEMMAWRRGVAKSPGGLKRNTTRERAAVAARQLEQVAPPLSPDGEEEENGRRESVDDDFDTLAALHRDANPGNPEHFSRSSLVSLDGSINNHKKKSKKRSSKTAAIASSHDIDQVISQFREQCDMHMATLLELKNNITTTEKEVNVSSEKDKEFQQVRQWYSALAEKHTKLQKEHQALQEEHVKLQERYMNLKRASNTHDSFVAHFPEAEEKKKEKKEKKSAVDIVWSRAVKPTGKAVGNVASKVTKKKHQQLQ